MKINKIREMSSPELEKELGEIKSEFFKLKFIALLCYPQFGCSHIQQPNSN